MQRPSLEAQAQEGSTTENNFGSGGSGAEELATNAADDDAAVPQSGPVTTTASIAFATK